MTTMFSTAHIAVTAVITALLVAVVAWGRLPRGRWSQVLVVALLAGASVFLWRISANMPQLNEDGLPGFSANDWAALILTYAVLGGYGDLRQPADPARYGQVRALAAVVALVVNVITI
jgi:hypothetical protein